MSRCSLEGRVEHAAATRLSKQRIIATQLEATTTTSTTLCNHQTLDSMLYEKVPLHEHEELAPSPPKLPRSSPWHRRLTAALIVAVLLSCSAWGPSPTGWSPAPHRCNHTLYAGEKLSWEKIGEIKGRTLEQSRLDVPMDQFNATNSGNKTFNLHLIRLRGKEGSDNLLLNPGGKLLSIIV